MAYQVVKNVAIEGIVATVPKDVLTNEDIEILGDNEERNKFYRATGISERRVVGLRDLCASDLCFESARKLIEELDWLSNEIECLIFVTQTPDYIVPSSSSILQDRLGLPKSCFAIQISLGCSGWVYGLATIAQLLTTGQLKKGLLLVGDTVTRTKSPFDKTTFPLFGDAGSATALSYKKGSSSFHFDTGTDGSGFDSIIIRDGGFRNFFTRDSLDVTKREDGSIRNNVQSYLDGTKVFTFGIRVAPESIKMLLDKANVKVEDLDYIFLHQANLMMNKIIGKKVGVRESKLPATLAHFGNTSGASIPLTIVNQFKNVGTSHCSRVVACGFGVGLSWATVLMSLSPIRVLNLNEI